MAKWLVGMIGLLFVVSTSSVVAVSEHDAVIDSVIEVIDKKPHAYDLSLHLIDALETYDDQGLIPVEKQSLIYNFWKQLMEYIVQVHEGDKQFGEIDQIADAYYYQDVSGVYSELGCYYGAPCGLKKVIGLDVATMEIVSNNVIKDGQGQLFIEHRKVDQNNLDIESFEELIAEGGRGVYFADKNGVYVRCSGEFSNRLTSYATPLFCLTTLEKDTFVYEDDGNFATDGITVYYRSTPVEGAIAKDFGFVSFEKRLADKMYNVYSDGITCFGVEVSLRSGYYMGGMVLIDNAFCE